MEWDWFGFFLDRDEGSIYNLTFIKPKEISVFEKLIYRVGAKSEKNISAFQYKKKKNTWFSGQNENQYRTRYYPPPPP